MKQAALDRLPGRFSATMGALPWYPLTAGYGCQVSQETPRRRRCDVTILSTSDGSRKSTSCIDLCMDVGIICDYRVEFARQSSGDRTLPKVT